VAKFLAAKKPDDEIIEELYLATYSRRPSADESKRVRAKVAEAPSKREGFEDLLWALLNTPEFALNH
jgi:hypothetical protein